MGVNGDRRRAVAPRINLNGGRRMDGLGNSWNVSGGAQVRLGPQFNSSVDVGYSRNIDDQQWNGNFTDNGVTSYTFARLYQATSSVTLRLNYTITPMLSLESYVQPFVSAGRYTNWRALRDGRTHDAAARFEPYTLRGEPEGFRFGQLRTNNVVRWEYRPGSVLFLVWTQGRDGFDSNPANFGIPQSYDAVFSRRPQNVFLMKASYWFGR
jgi:hypothetical protein